MKKDEGIHRMIYPLLTLCYKKVRNLLRSDAQENAVTSPVNNATYHNATFLITSIAKRSVRFSLIFYSTISPSKDQVLTLVIFTFT